MEPRPSKEQARMKLANRVEVDQLGQLQNLQQTLQNRELGQLAQHLFRGFGGTSKTCPTLRLFVCQLPLHMGTGNWPRCQALPVSLSGTAVLTLTRNVCEGPPGPPFIGLLANCGGICEIF